MIRAIDFDRDAEAVCRIMGEFDSEPLTVEGLLIRWRDKDQAVDPLRLVWEEDGAVQGYLNCRRWSFTPEGRALVDVGVSEAFSRRGIGSALMRRGLEHAGEVGWTTPMSRAKETEDCGPERFLESFGFERNYVHFESVMDVDQVSADYSGLVAAKEAEGYRFLTWEELGDTEAHRKRLHRLVIEADEDEPGFADFGAMTLESFVMDTFDDPDFFASGLVVAILGDEWAGTHQLMSNEDGNTDGSVGYTGVLKDHRGKGLATALKWIGLEVAREKNWKTVVTHNDSRNAPMLAVNERFGFVKRPGWVHYKKELSA